VRLGLAFLLLAGVAHAETQEEAIAAYCTQRAQTRPPAERSVPIEGCKALIRGAYESMTKQKIAEAMDQLRAVDELMTTRREAAAAATVETHRSDHGVRREPVRPQRRKQDAVDPTAKPRPNDDDATLKRKQRELEPVF
jgi:hypothetical protein